MECSELITVGIAETDGVIRQLAKQFFTDCGFRCGRALQKTDSDFIFCSPKPNGRYDILIENNTPATGTHGDYVHLVNSDEVIPLPGSEHTVFITYGLNTFATATASSITEDGSHLHFQYCLQRNIVSLKGKMIECQEFPVSVYHSKADLHSAIAFTTLALLLSVPAEKLQQIVTDF